MGRQVCKSHREYQRSGFSLSSDTILLAGNDRYLATYLDLLSVQSAWSYDVQIIVQKFIPMHDEKNDEQLKWTTGSGIQLVPRSKPSLMWQNVELLVMRGQVQEPMRDRSVDCGELRSNGGSQLGWEQYRGKREEGRAVGGEA